MQLTTVPEYLKAIANGPISQPDAVTCQSTCISAAIGGETSIGHIREALFQLGNPGDPAVMAKFLSVHFGDRYSLHLEASIDEMRSWIKEGCLLITHAWFTKSGHVICLDGVDDLGFRAMDPWEEFNAPQWEYLTDIEAFQGVYSDRLIYAACVASLNHYDAHDIYLSGTIDRSREGAWIHKIKP